MGFNDFLKQFGRVPDVEGTGGETEETDLEGTEEAPEKYEENYYEDPNGGLWESEESYLASLNPEESPKKPYIDSQGGRWASEEEYLQALLRKAGDDFVGDDPVLGGPLNAGGSSEESLPEEQADIPSAAIPMKREPKVVPISPVITDEPLEGMLVAEEPGVHLPVAEDELVLGVPKTEIVEEGENDMLEQGREKPVEESKPRPIGASGENKSIETLIQELQRSDEVLHYQEKYLASLRARRERLNDAIELLRKERELVDKEIDAVSIKR